MNLCNTCENDFAECNSSEIEFGNGKGSDNVIGCNTYQLRSALNEGCCPNCGCEVFAKHDYGKVICCRCFEIY